MSKENLVTKPLIGAQEIQEMVKKNTEAIMKDIIAESVKAEMKKIIKEDEDPKYEEEDVEDVKAETTPEKTVEMPEEKDETEEEETEEVEEKGEEEETENEWEDVDQFRVDDDTYDFSNANDEDVLKVFKLMKDDDKIVVKKDEEGIEITDNESGNTYLIKDGEEEIEEDLEEDLFEVDFTKIGKAISETDLGYTDTYQGKTAMTTLPVSEEPSPSEVNDWDKGVPKTNDNVQRFGKAKLGEEVIKDEEDKEIELDEAGLTRTKANLRQRAGQKSQPQIDNTEGKRVDKVRQGTTLTSTVTESKIKAMEAELKLIKEKNNLLKEAVNQFKQYANDYYKAAQAASVTNYKMGKIVKLFTEHSTTLNEKKSIVERFEKETNTTAQINTLYEAINSELSNKKIVSETIVPTNVTVSNTKPINENTIYANDKIKEINNLWDRLSKVR